MKTEKFSPFDTADYLWSEAEIEAYLLAAMEDDDPQAFAVALGNVLRARNVSALARETGLTREGLYKAFSPQGNPSYATVSKVSRAIGFKLQLIPDPVLNIDHFLRPNDPHDSRYEVPVVNLASKAKRRPALSGATKGRAKSQSRGTPKSRTSKAVNNPRSKR